MLKNYRKTLKKKTLMCYETVNNIKLVKLCISRYNESKAVTLMSYSHFILRNKSKTKQKTESLIHLTYILQSNLQKWHKSCHSVLGRVDIYIPFKRTLRGIIAKRYKTQQTKTNKKRLVREGTMKEISVLGL